VDPAKFAPRLVVIKKPGYENPFFEKLGIQAGIGALGVPAQTAYYGAIDVGKFTEKDVVVVSGAAGATGSIVGQIAKKILKAKKVIGIAGGAQKAEYLVKELGFDAAIDYKEYNTQEKIRDRLKEIAGPDEVTAYFDNTGGFITDAIFDVIAKYGRIVICGQISVYHKPNHVYPNYLLKTIYKELSILGFGVSNHTHENSKKFYPDVSKWVEQGVIKAPDTVVHGFENLPKAYQMLYTGENYGKIIIQV